ncbi:MAG TPA: alpha/beta hydrolase [Bryobacteraceae bacterium]
MRPFFRVALLTGLAAVIGLAQQTIPLPFKAGAGASPKTYPEKQYFSKAWHTEVVTDVSKPSLMVYKPLAGKANHAAIVICPGGGFMALSIESEGIEVAHWLAAKGFTAFVLKYRLAPTRGDATEEFEQLWRHNKEKFRELIGGTVPLSMADGLAAMTYVRKHASDWKVSPDRVGIVGFSAGGTVAAAAALRYSPESRPAFAGLLYPATSMFKAVPVPADAPPIFIAAATDDNLGLAGNSVAFYEKWTAAHKSAELHMYARGRHGFGMHKQGTTSDRWIDEFWDWLKMEKISEKL